MTKQAILIAGPTASGKSALAIKLARALDGIIINADSMQIYKELRVLTARPSEAEEAAAPHRLYGILSGREACSAMAWARMAQQEIESIWNAAKMPILVGGTGMYFKTLLEGMAEIPDIDPDIRQRVRERVRREGPEALHRDLERVDPVIAARLEPGDSQRICRALEVYYATGRPLSDWQQKTSPGFLSAFDGAGRVQKYSLDWPRDALYARCNARFDHMLDEGGLEEVRDLLSLDLDPSLPVMKSLGVPSLAGYLRGEQSLERAVEDAKMQTRRFAKRQNTWFRNQFHDWDRLIAQQMESEMQKIFQKINKSGLTE